MKKMLSLAIALALCFSLCACVGNAPQGKSALDWDAMQEELQAKEYEATAGGGVIKAVCGGDRELKSITIDPEAVDPEDVEMLQDMIVAAVNEAMRKAEADQSANMAKLTGGLNLGGLF